MNYRDLIDDIREERKKDWELLNREYQIEDSIKEKFAEIEAFLELLDIKVEGIETVQMQYLQEWRQYSILRMPIYGTEWLDELIEASEPLSQKTVDKMVYEFETTGSSKYKRQLAIVLGTDMCRDYAVRERVCTYLVEEGYRSQEEREVLHGQLGRFLIHMHNQYLEQGDDKNAREYYARAYEQLTLAKIQKYIPHKMSFYEEEVWLNQTIKEQTISNPLAVLDKLLSFTEEGNLYLKERRYELLVKLIKEIETSRDDLSDYAERIVKNAHRFAGDAKALLEQYYANLRAEWVKDYEKGIDSYIKQSLFLRVIDERYHIFGAGRYVDELTTYMKQRLYDDLQTMLSSKNAHTAMQDTERFDDYVRKFAKNHKNQFENWFQNKIANECEQKYREWAESQIDAFDKVPVGLLNGQLEEATLTWYQSKAKAHIRKMQGNYSAVRTEAKRLKDVDAFNEDVMRPIFDMQMDAFLDGLFNRQAERIDEVERRAREEELARQREEEERLRAIEEAKQLAEQKEREERERKEREAREELERQEREERERKEAEERRIAQEERERQRRLQREQEERERQEREAREAEERRKAEEEAKKEEERQRREEEKRRKEAERQAEEERRKRAIEDAKRAKQAAKQKAAQDRLARKAKRFTHGPFAMITRLTFYDRPDKDGLDDLYRIPFCAMLYACGSAIVNSTMNPEALFPDNVLVGILLLAFSCAVNMAIGMGILCSVVHKVKDFFIPMEKRYINSIVKGTKHTILHLLLTNGLSIGVALAMNQFAALPAAIVANLVGYYVFMIIWKDEW